MLIMPVRESLDTSQWVRKEMGWDRSIRSIRNILWGKHKTRFGFYGTSCGGLLSGFKSCTVLK